MPEPVPAGSVVREASTSAEPLSVDRLLARVRDPRVGGVALFVGVVRDHDHGDAVTSLDYTAHPTAAAALATCAERTAAAYDVLAIAVSHRTGHLEVGDLAVVVAVGAVHRQPALEACRHLIDTLKEQVPIWKEQALTDGTSEWVGLGDGPDA
ncbi:molybdenum cofactor biosynthesis protein MoaE [Microlunatus spumicola]|uniref:Molybdenum cofactor biosynthesis protein MoaE n=1 Tax=Microlunatus spumicola TaxID=81499 RepID=A0ABP6WTH3_9ACTN